MRFTQRQYGMTEPLCEYVVRTELHDLCDAFFFLRGERNTPPGFCKGELAMVRKPL